MSKLVLLVEDDEDNKQVIEMIVQFVMGHKVVIAEGGQEAIRLAKENKPDLILMDLSLPDLDGWKVTEILKQMDDFKQVPIIALTAHAMVGDREKALEAGCDDYLTKPVDIDTLTALVGRYLPA